MGGGRGWVYLGSRQDTLIVKQNIVCNSNLTKLCYRCLCCCLHCYLSCYLGCRSSYLGNINVSINERLPVKSNWDVNCICDKWNNQFTILMAACIVKSCLIWKVKGDTTFLVKVPVQWRQKTQKNGWECWGKIAPSHGPLSQPPKYAPNILTKTVFGKFFSLYLHLM